MERATHNMPAVRYRFHFTDAGLTSPGFPLLPLPLPPFLPLPFLPVVVLLLSLSLLPLPFLSLLPLPLLDVLVSSVRRSRRTRCRGLTDRTTPGRLREHARKKKSQAPCLAFILQRLYLCVRDYRKGPVLVLVLEVHKRRQCETLSIERCVCSFWSRGVILPNEVFDLWTALAAAGKTFLFLYKSEPEPRCSSDVL